MKIKIFKPVKYKECPIYFRQINTHFEYLVVIDNEIYTSHVDIQPTVINKILYYLAVEPEKFSEQQYKKILGLLQKMAETTVDHIKNKK